MSATSFAGRSAQCITRPRPPRIEVHRISDDIGWRQARGLMLEYLAWVGLVTGLDPFAVQPWLRDELRHLDSWYAPPRGMLLLASVDFQPVGVAGVEVQPEGWAELKRLYVTPDGRGHRLGERLVLEAMFAAADLGCQTIRLESLPGPMDRAIALYRRLGFRPTASIGHTNVDNVLSLECSLGSAADLLRTRPRCAGRPPARHWTEAKIGGAPAPLRRSQL